MSLKEQGETFILLISPKKQQKNLETNSDHIASINY
jgi:hypothetical protein